MIRFWSKVAVESPSECWQWKAARMRNTKFDYGIFNFNGLKRHAHRIAWILTNGEIPNGVCVLHKCDNPPCVNPGHLFLGSKGDNARDRETKGRSHDRKWDSNGRAKLTLNQAKEIKHRASLGEKRCDLAKQFGVSPVAVSYLCIGKNWKGLKVDNFRVPQRVGEPVG